jgi:hypothetical protein
VGKHYLTCIPNDVNNYCFFYLFNALFLTWLEFAGEPKSRMRIDKGSLNIIIKLSDQRDTLQGFCHFIFVSFFTPNGGG